MDMRLFFAKINYIDSRILCQFSKGFGCKQSGKLHRICNSMIPITLILTYLWIIIGVHAHIWANNYKNVLHFILHRHLHISTQLAIISYHVWILSKYNCLALIVNQSTYSNDEKWYCHFEMASSFFSIAIGHFPDLRGGILDHR